MMKVQNFAAALRRGYCFAALGAFLGVAVADETKKEEEESTIVKSQQYLSDTVLNAANRIDNFFSNERHVAGDNKTRVTLRGNLDFIEGRDADPGGEVKIYLALPGLNDRLRLVVNDDDEDGGTSGGPSDEEDQNIALRFIGKAEQKYGVSFDVGIGSRDGDLQPFGRVNLFKHYRLGGKWDGRTANRLYWYTDAGWRNDFRQYFEYKFADGWFFRSRTRIDYQEDKLDAAYPEQRFTLFQQINSKTALAYEIIGRQYCACDPVYDDSDRLVTNTDRYNLGMVRLRFRQNVFYPWLFYELWPTAAWPEERDYEFTAAIRLRIEVALGDIPSGIVKLEE